MRRIAWRTVPPALLAILLFSGVVFLYLLPSVDRVVMDQKRLLIRELTESAWNVLARFEAEERAGRMTRAEAQAAAVAQARNLHYGQENKDYFFIIDETPRMVVHPYRPDLEGTDLVDFRDPDGKRLFVEMAEAVRRDGAGYVDYRWQWKDDADRIVPKLSYVKGFAPWGWILGTGVYTEDVDAEIRALKGNLQTASLLILAVVSLLLWVLLRTGHQAERGRRRAAAALQVSEEKYRGLVESAGEAILMSMAGEGLYANRSLLGLLGYTDEEFAGLDVETILSPTEEELASGRRHWRDVADGVEAPTRYEAGLVRKDGGTLRVMLTLSRIVVRHRAGFMAVAARLAQPRDLDVMVAADPEDLAAASRGTRDLATLMMNHGADAAQVCRRLSAGADDLVRKAVEFIVAELGPPPVVFDVLLMGSLGRGEVTLSADQDHALIYPDVPEADAVEVQGYFLALGARLADLLDGAGYPYCQGKIMASEAACCQSLSGWCAAFDRWTGALEAEDLLQAKIFFDFRSALDEGELVPALRDHLKTSLARRPRFVPMLAHNILLFEPPLNAFGKLDLVESGDGRQAFDVKGVLAQVADVARLRALQHGLDAVGTVERLEAAAAAGHLRLDLAEATIDAFSVLFDLRLRHQARRRADRLEVDNLLDPTALPLDRLRDLKRALGHVKALQENLRHEFGVRQ